MKYSFFRIIQIIICIISIIIFIPILFDAIIGLSALPYKNGVACVAPLFGDLNEFYKNKGFVLDSFIFNGLTFFRFKIYVGVYIILQNFVLLVCLIVKNNKRGRSS